MNHFLLFGLSLLLSASAWSQGSGIDQLRKLVRVKPTNVIQTGRTLLTKTQGRDQLEVHYCMGTSFRILGQLDSASLHLYAAVGQEALLTNEQKIRFYTELGVVLKQQYKTALALPYYQKALQLAEQTGDKQSYSKLLNNIGRIHFDRRDYAEAEYFYRRALKMNSRDAVKSNAILYHNLGAIHEKREDLDSARHYYTIALKGYESIEDKILIAYGYCSLARTESDLDLASRLIDRSILIRKELGLRADLEESFLVKARLLLKRNDTGKALQVADTTELLARETGHVNILLEVLQLKSEIFARRGDHAQAYAYLNMYSELQNKEVEEETARLIKGFTSDFKHKQTVRELEFLRQQDSLQQRVIVAKNEALTLKGRQTYLYLTLLLVLLGIALLLVRLLRQLRRKNIRLNEQGRALKQSNEEKEILLKEVNHRVKNNLQIASGIVRRGLDHITDEKARQVILENVHSVETIAMIHDTIYRQGQLSAIDVRSYICDLAEKTLSSLDQRGDFRLEVHPFTASINADQAIHLGHLVSEWVMNAVKHARPEGATLIIEVGQVKEEGRFFLYFRDNGAQPAKEAFLNSTQFGNRLMQSSVRKMSGHELIVNDVDGFELRFDCTNWHEK